jgi:pyruvate/2-oxoglutarate dehydrogenase complex dihydrolipoamide acyltransferase (E2) component
MQKKRKRGRPHSGTSVRAAAALMNVSERQVHLAGELLRSGRADLIEATESGKTTLAAALRELRAARLPDRHEKLVLAWNRCDDEERGRFLIKLVQMGVVMFPPDDDS